MIYPERLDPIKVDDKIVAILSGQVKGEIIGIRGNLMEYTPHTSLVPEKGATTRYFALLKWQGRQVKQLDSEEEKRLI